MTLDSSTVARSTYCAADRPRRTSRCAMLFGRWSDFGSSGGMLFSTDDDTWHERDDRQYGRKHREKRHHAAIDVDDRLFHAVGSEEQIHSNRRCQIPDLEVQQEDHAEVQRIDAEQTACGNDQR